MVGGSSKPKNQSLTSRLCHQRSLPQLSPTEDAARKLIYLAIQNAVPQWTRTGG
jgi:hypothetical protein